MTEQMMSICQQTVRCINFTSNIKVSGMARHNKSINHVLSIKLSQVSKATTKTVKCYLPRKQNEENCIQF